MAWDTQLLPAVRALVNDEVTPGVNPKYTDSQLRTILAVSAMQLAMDAPTLAQDYTVTIVPAVITPDPSADAPYMTLLAMKGACTLSRGQAAKASGMAVRVIEHRSELDLRGVFTARLAAADGNWCKAYKVALDDYFKGQLAAAEFALAVVTPVSQLTSAREVF